LDGAVVSIVELQLFKVAAHFQIVDHLDQMVGGMENEQNALLIQVSQVSGHQTCNLQSIWLPIK
jgi:hypothetical protein